MTGFRGSINTALAAERKETSAIDVIAAEDIGKFPDSNLAESMQRVPGVTLSRGDGGEGRNISVRGLGPQFTRVRINGMEGAAQMGSSDIYGAGNSRRTFDFNVFPTEIFSELKVVKTPTAARGRRLAGRDGGSHRAATLRLRRRHDFHDHRARRIQFRGRVLVDRRASMLFSKKFFDETFGVLASVAYQKRNIREVGYSAVDVLAANTNSVAVGGVAIPYCTPIGWTLSAPAPAYGVKGSDVNNCSTGNPRTGVISQNDGGLESAPNLVARSRRQWRVSPRLPRYVNSEQDTERTGGTLTFQWQPSENTSLSLDGLMSKYQVERRGKYYILGLSFGRSIAQNGQPMVSVKDIEFDQNGSMVYGLFDGVDVRSEGLVDQFVSKFQQVNLKFNQHFNDKFSMTARAGRSVSRWAGPMRLQTFLDAIDVDNFSVDFRGGRETPLINFGNLALTDSQRLPVRAAAGGCHGARRLLHSGQAFPKTLPTSTPSLNCRATGR